MSWFHQHNFQGDFHKHRTNIILYRSLLVSQYIEQSSCLPRPTQQFATNTSLVWTCFWRVHELKCKVWWTPKKFKNLRHTCFVPMHRIPRVLGWDVRSWEVSPPLRPKTPRKVQVIFPVRRWLIGFALLLEFLGNSRNYNIFFQEIHWKRTVFHLLQESWHFVNRTFDEIQPTVTYECITH